MEAVPRYVFEVCDDLGSGLLTTMRRVIIPLAAPGIFAGVIFIFVNSLGVFLIPDILGGAGAVNAGTLVINAIANAAVMIIIMLTLLLIGHWLFDLTKLLEPIR